MKIIGVGCDIVKVSRVNEQLAHKILSDEENILLINKPNKKEFIAGRWAAKEAIIKALDIELGFKEISVIYAENGKPICNIEGYHIHLSISHESEYAISNCIITRENY